MTTHITHIWRLLKWGRTLARHGALTGIERDPLTPSPVRRLVRVARLGAFEPARQRDVVWSHSGLFPPPRR